LLTLKKYESAKQQVPVFALHSVYWLLFCVLRAAVFTAVAAFDAGGLSYFEAYIMCCLPSSFIRKLLRFVVMLDPEGSGWISAENLATYFVTHWHALALFTVAMRVRR
jgi:hypothetical protein